MNDRKLTTGFYRPTDSFRSISEHVAVCFEDDLTLVAIVGASDDDTDHVLESHQYAQLFAAAPETLKKLSNALARNAELETSNKRLQGFYDDVEVDNLRKSERIVTLKETVNRQTLMIYAKDRQIAELTRMLFALGKQDGQTIRTQAAEIEILKGHLLAIETITALSDYEMSFKSFKAIRAHTLAAGGES